jgi:hypothetical protein
MRWKLLGGVAAIVVAGLGVYAWGNGAFFPCGPVLNLLGSADCRVIASWPATQPQMLELLPDGTLLTALRGDGREPTEPQKLVQFSADGKPISETTLPSLPPKLAWGRTAISADGKLVAFGSLDKPATVLDRSTGAEIGSVERYGVAYLGFSGDDKLLINMGAGSFERPPENTAQVFTFDGAQVGEVSGPEAAPIFTTGIAAASTADGKLIAQHIESRGDTGIVAVRFIEPEFASWAGQLLVAPLTGWRLGGQQLPQLSFSPSGEYLAGSFDAPDEWGKENSALIVWRLSDRQMVARVPTWRAQWRDMVWLPDRPEIAVQRFHLDSRTGDVAVIRYRE